MIKKKTQRGEKYTQRRTKSLARKFEKGIEKAVDRILDKLQNGETIRDEEIRLLKNYQGLLDGIRARKRTERVKPLPEGKLKDILEKEKIKYGLGGDLVMESAGYYRCIHCGYWHKKEDKCPYKEAEKEKKKNDKSNADN